MLLPQHPFFVATALATYLAQGVHAGPSANMNACLWQPLEPIVNTTVTFDVNVGANTCMNKRGTSNTVYINSIGLFCASLGEVEAKFSSTGGDTCATDESHWGLSWRTEGNPPKSTGSTNSRWYYGSRIRLHGSTPNTYLCTSYARCTDIDAYWPGNGENLWVVFEPASIQGIDSAEEIGKHLRLQLQVNDDL
ncbi:hypothetical protein B7494_g8136 [Chlorociboria aeruginascens]|nr:hypothetical protein B7494_g8136 [Chlorociboria aeruginascens]